MELKWKGERARVEDLVPYVNNAKIHTAEQVDQLCSSIEQFGFNDPVGVWTAEDGHLEIVEGHGRVMAAKKLGMDKVPIIKLDHLDDEARRAYTHVHNKLNMNTGFDWAILDEELANLNFDFEEFGFEMPSPDEDTFESKYTTKTEGLIYEPSDEVPDVGELVDTVRFDELVAALDGFDLDAPVRSFLEMACCRFLVFDYQLIADYYASAPDEVKRAFEQLKLVIVDYGGRIEEAAKVLDDDVIEAADVL